MKRLTKPSAQTPLGTAFRRATVEDGLGVTLPATRELYAIAPHAGRLHVDQEVLAAPGDGGGSPPETRAHCPSGIRREGSARNPRMPASSGSESTMHSHSIDDFQHSHDHTSSTGRHEVRTRWVVAITATMMVGELVVGSLTNSMALTADGWHMATHAGALGMSALAYWFARTRARASAFSFGTGKVYALAGYTSAVVLGLVAVLMLVESCRRLVNPLPIHFGEALPVAILGLLVNLASVKLLDADDHHHHHAPEDSDHNHGHASHDHNLRAAYFHVLADAFTSILAIGALVGGRYAGWNFLDPAMGIVGGLVILRWGVGLCRDSARPLLDVVPSADLAEQIRRGIEQVDDARVADLHLWEMSPGQHACIVSLVTEAPRDTKFYREAILRTSSIAHLTVEVQRCEGH